MYPNDCDYDLELSEVPLSEEYKVPEEPDHWELDDFDDLVRCAELV
jgi:hypothetical protein